MSVAKKENGRLKVVFSKMEITILMEFATCREKLGN